MMQHVEVQDIFNGTLNILYAGVTELYDLVAVGANQVIVLFIAIRFLVLRQILPKLMLAHQVAFYQQIERIVNGCPTHAVVLVFHTYVQGLNVKVAVARVDLFQDRVSLGRLSQLLVLKVSRENFLHLIVNLRIYYHFK
jgi:hypothetical protein